MRRMDVRCSGQPRELLGTVAVPEVAEVGGHVVLAADNPTRFVRLRVSRWHDSEDPSRCGVALRADTVSIEILRTFRTFIEADPQ